MQIKKSKIWLLSKEQLETVIKQSCNLSAVLEAVGLPPHGGNYKILYKRLKNDNIDYSSMLKELSLSRGKRKSLDEILVCDSSYNRSFLKKKLLKLGLLDNRCNICKLAPMWNGKELSLQIDHINGIFNDNRIENLRILCPNCHAQTSSFGGKNKKCGSSVPYEKLNHHTREYKPRLNNRKVKRPSKEELAEWLWKEPTLQIAKNLGVSDKAITKWAKSYGLEKPTRGYWTKKNT